LEESLKAFERGVSLVRRCNSLLDGAEQRIEILAGELPEDLTR
ncbi:exodeoxyribonuclease VII small subunit, partial [Methanocrinis sp.]